MKNAQSKTILLVEHDTLSAQADAETLSSLGYQIVITGPAEKAVEIICSDQALDLVLIDIAPDYASDAAWLAKQILNFRQIPILFLASHLSTEMVECIKTVPCDGVVDRNSNTFFWQSSIETTLQLFEQHQQRLQGESYLQQIASALREVIWLRDYHTRQVLYVNPAFEQLCGLPCEEFYKNPNAFIDVIHPEDRKWVKEGVLGRSDVHRIVHVDGSIRWVWGRTFPVLNEAGEIYRSAVIAEDITERKHAEEELKLANVRLENQMDEIQRLQSSLRDQVIRDPLTSLYNRRYLNETLDRELSRALREGYPVSLVMIDIDDFKNVNDTYGHYAGDLVLKNLAQLLTRQTRSSDLVCRLGGDEFLLVFPNVPANIACERAEHYRQSFQDTTTLFDQIEIRATLSLGIAVFPKQGETSLEVLKAADRALYQAKAKGRNRLIAL
ncbi:MAG: diguanylate cyclase [Anaerolineaceae bacterium]|nr:diguanylate cyclase [Anaerolineaceae bacterium]